jgi:hypothetical protein
MRKTWAVAAAVVLAAAAATGGVVVMSGAGQATPAAQEPLVNTATRALPDPQQPTQPPGTPPRMHARRRSGVDAVSTRGEKP